MNSTIEQIKDRLSIVDVVSQYVTLEKSGSNYKGRSPFTNEKTPSFFVSAERNLYHCFSSGKGGDIFTFISEMEGVDFKGALRILAERAGVSLTPTDKSQSDLRERLFAVMKDCAYFYQQSLLRKPEALTYLESRGITSDTIKMFGIGYAPKQWNGAYTWLHTKAHHKKEDIVSAGVAKQGERADPYDRLRERIVFPIRDAAGRVIAFTGRILPGSTAKDANAKYINSPETDLYKKSEVLFGFDLAKQSIRTQKTVLVMEGQMDVILAHQYGYANAIALSGTAFSDTQVTLIARLATSVVFALDSDTAGKKALLKSSFTALKHGLIVHSLSLPDGKDPADIFSTNSREWEELFSKRKHIITALIQEVTEKEHDKHARQHAIAKMVYPLIKALPSKTEQGYFIHEVTRALVGVNEAMVQSEIARLQIDDFVTTEHSVTSPIPERNNISVTAEEIFSVIRWQRGLQTQMIPVDEIEAEVSSIIKKYEIEHDLIVAVSEQKIFEVELKYQDSDEDLHKKVRGLIEVFRKRCVDWKRNKIQQQIADAERKEDVEKLEKLKKEYQQIS